MPVTLCHCPDGEEPSLADLLDDPVIQAVMTCDGTSRNEVEGLVYAAVGKAVPTRSGGS